MGRLTDRLFWAEEGQAKSDKRFRRDCEDRDQLMAQGSYPDSDADIMSTRQWFVRDIPLVLGPTTGLSIGLVFGDLLYAILMGFAVGNVVTSAIRYTAGSSAPSLRERFSAHLTDRS